MCGAQGCRRHRVLLRWHRVAVAAARPQCCHCHCCCRSSVQRAGWHAGHCCCPQLQLHSLLCARSTLPLKAQACGCRAVPAAQPLDHHQLDGLAGHLLAAQRMARLWLADWNPAPAAVGNAQSLGRPCRCLLQSLLRCSTCIANQDGGVVATLETACSRSASQHRCPHDHCEWLPMQLVLCSTCCLLAAVLPAGCRPEFPAG